MVLWFFKAIAFVVVVDVLFCVIIVALVSVCVANLDRVLDWWFT